MLINDLEHTAAVMTIRLLVKVGSKQITWC